MIFNIPIDPTILNQEKSLILSGTQYFLTFAFNQRSESWYFDLADANRSPIVSNKPLLPGADLLRFIDSSVRPAGILFVYNNVGREFVADRDNLGIDFFLIYGDTTA